MGDPFAPPKIAPPRIASPRPKWRWKLWHFSALVTAAAPLLALEHYAPGSLAGVGILGVILIPMLLSVVAWDWLMARLLQLGRFPTGSIRSRLAEMLLFLIICAAWGCWIVLVISIFKIPWKS
jgi:hypothetical protein